MAAKSEVWLDNPNWNVDCFPGCCGAEIIFRLNAEYLSQEEVEVKIKNLEHPWSKLDPIIKIGSLCDQVQRTRWCARYLQITSAFGAVLDDMHSVSKNALFFATDSISSKGDVHTGEFSTKNFIVWLKENDLVTISSTPLANKKIQGWGFTLKKRNTYNMIRRMRNKYVRDYNKLVDFGEKHAAAS